MTRSLTLKNYSLKNVLRLFDENSVITALSLGDTWHPCGFVDERILKGKQTVKEVLDFPYNFEGLVDFECCIGDMTLKLSRAAKGDETSFDIYGPDYKIRNLEAYLL